MIFTNSFNHWYTAGTSSSDACPFSHYLTYSADSFMHGHFYKTVHDSMPAPLYIVAGCTVGGSSLANMFWVREDTTAGMVYYREPAIDTLEHLLYNYNLHLGDTIHYTQYMSYVTDTVVAIDSIMISGIIHKVFTMHGLSSPAPFMRAYTVVEGLGCTGNPWLPAFFPGCFEYFEKLLCFSQGSYNPTITVPYFMCGLYGADTFRNCSYTTLTIPLANGMQTDIAVGPNPATNSIRIAANGKFMPNTFVTIFDFTGKRVFQANESELNSTLSVNTSLWSDGLYLVVVQDRDVVLKKEMVFVRK